MVEVAKVDARAAVETNVRIFAFVIVDALGGAQPSLALGATIRKKARRKYDKLTQTEDSERKWVGNY